MRTVLRHYFRLDRAEFERMWKEALFSFDASALLNLYGYSEQTRDNLIEVIKSYADRTRLPYQFAHEYARNRASTIIKQIKNYQETEKDFGQIASKRLQPKREHPFLSTESSAAFNGIQKELEGKRKALEAMVNSDECANVLLDAFENRIGQAPDKATLSQFHKDAAARFAIKVPPGYMDAKTKDVPDCFGDYIGWRQLMNIAASEKKDFILVTDDFKEDWWQIESERTIMPRPELLEEFFNETGQSVWMYTSESFLIAAKEYDASGIKDEVIREVRARLDAQKAEQAEAKLTEPRAESAKKSRAAELLEDMEKLAAPSDKATSQDDVKRKVGDADSGDE